MAYYVRPSGREAVIKCDDNDSWKPRQKVVADLEGDKPLVLNSSANTKPSYEIGKVNGVIDVIEHRERNGIFYMTDDLDVLQELGLLP